LQLISTKDSSTTDCEELSTRGRQFAEEAESHLALEKEVPSITLLQGQFVMFAYEGNVGAGTKAMDYFLDALGTYEAINTVHVLESQNYGKDEARLLREKEGLSWVMWGLYCAEW
jgi:hypothetical protein